MSNIEDGALANKKCLSAGTQPEIFQGRRGFEELGHFDKHFVKNTRKKGPTGNNFGAFLLDTIKARF